MEVVRKSISAEHTSSSNPKNWSRIYVEENNFEITYVSHSGIPIRDPAVLVQSGWTFDLST